MSDITLDTYIVSDTHFGHDNIVRYCNRPQNHEQVIVQNWNAIVQDDDVVLHLGDLIFNSSRGSVFARQLKGRKFLLKGNHDSGSNKWFEDRGFTKLPFPTLYWAHDGNRILFTHKPYLGSDIPWDINIHGHIHNNGYHMDELSSLDPNRDYRNVSIEVMDYKPVRLEEVLYGGKYESSREHQMQTSA